MFVCELGHGRFGDCLRGLCAIPGAFQSLLSHLSGDAPERQIHDGYYHPVVVCGATTSLFRPIYFRKFRDWLADRMPTDDDWKDEEKEFTVLIILFEQGVSPSRQVPCKRVLMK